MSQKDANITYPQWVNLMFQGGRCTKGSDKHYNGDFYLLSPDNSGKNEPKGEPKPTEI